MASQRFHIVDMMPTEVPCARCEGTGDEPSGPVERFCSCCHGDGRNLLDLSRWASFAHNVSTVGFVLVAIAEQRETAVQCAACALAEVA
jgi:endogenous inhibitor of DNA gyrase (YacG/DUF329 family)